MSLRVCELCLFESSRQMWTILWSRDSGRRKTRLTANFGSVVCTRIAQRPVGPRRIGTACCKQSFPDLFFAFKACLAICSCCIAVFLWQIVYQTRLHRSPTDSRSVKRAGNRKTGLSDNRGDKEVQWQTGTTRTQANIQKAKQTNKPTHKQTNAHTNEWANEQTNKPTQRPSSTQLRTIT